MPACIDPDLSYCLIDGHPLFLDLAGDRYFRLPATTEQAFLAHLDGAPLASAAARMLVARGIAPAAEQASPDAAAGAATLAPPPKARWSVRRTARQAAARWRWMSCVMSARYACN